MSESQSKQLRVTLKRSGVTAEYVVLSTDMKTVQEAISGVGGVVGPENCLTLGVAAAAGTAIYVLVKSIARNWPWIKETKVQQDNVVEISAKPGKEESLANLVKNGSLEKFVKNAFENLDDNLEGILGEEIYNKYGDEVLDLIKDIRIGAITTNTKESDLPQNIKALNAVVNATVDEKIYNKHDFMAVDKNEKGPVVGNYAGAGAHIKQEIHGGGVMMAVGYGGKDLSNMVDAYKNLAGDCIRVKIKVPKPDGDVKYFDRKFQPTQTIDEVIMALKGEEKEFYHIFRGDDKLDGDLTLAQAAQDASVVNWEAKKQ